MSEGLKYTQSKRRNNQYRILTCFASLLIVIIPVLSPYGLFGIDITLLLCVAFIVVYVFVSRPQIIKISNWSKYIPLIIYILGSMFLSLNGFFVLKYSGALLNSLIALTIYLLFYIVAWKKTDFDNTLRYADIIGLICCMYAAYQFLMQITGNVVPLGKINFLEIKVGWVPETWGWRFNSLFSEPSYFAIYLMPLFAVHFVREEWVKTIIYGAFILLSSSSLGILAMVAVVGWRLVVLVPHVKKWVKHITIFIVILVVGIWAFTQIPALSNLANGFVGKIVDIFTGQDKSESSNMRLLGNLEYFWELPLKEKLFGVGISQMQNYFLEHGINLPNYSNSFVLALINSGIIGFLLLCYYFISTLKYSIRTKVMPFFLMIFLAALVDSLMLSYRFFWLIYFVYEYKLSRNNKKGSGGIWRFR